MSLSIRNENQVIPIMLEECDIPDQLTDLTYTDLTDYHDISNKMKLLKSAIKKNLAHIDEFNVINSTTMSPPVTLNNNYQSIIIKTCISKLVHMSGILYNLHQVRSKV